MEVAVSLVPSVVEPSQVAERRQARSTIIPLRPT